jgi:hypothetical protein
VDDPSARQQGEHFRDAIARHQLSLQTDLKKSTSLPGAMFDAADAMLEARLCEATERIFRVLLEQEVPPPPVDPGELRLEPVASTETLALVRAAASGAFAGEPPDLGDGDTAELQAVLAETCARSEGLPRERAAALLRGDRSREDVDALARELLQQLTAATTAGDAVQLGELAARIASAVLAGTAAAEPPPTKTGGGPT